MWISQRSRVTAKRNVLGLVLLLPVSTFKSCFRQRLRLGERVQRVVVTFDMVDRNNNERCANKTNKSKKAIQIREKSIDLLYHNYLYLFYIIFITLIAKLNSQNFDSNFLHNILNNNSFSAEENDYCEADMEGISKFITCSQLLDLENCQIPHMSRTEARSSMIYRFDRGICTL